jgi:hypothetical protein
MSRYRNIHCLIWNDDKFPFLSSDAKLVFFHILTTPFSTPFGCYKAGKSALEEESRMDPKGYAKGFRECFEKGIIKYDEQFHLIFIPNHMKYNPPANPNVVRNWGKLFDELPKSELLIDAYSAIERVCEGLGKGFHEAFQKGFGIPFRKGMAIQEQYQYTGTGSGTGSGTDTPLPPAGEPVAKKSKPKLNQDRFNLFWKAYPKKAAKPNAEKAFEKIDPDESLLDAMLSAIAWQSQTEDWIKESGNFIPHPATWLNGRRWEDQPPNIPRMSALTAKNLAHGKEFVNGNYGQNGIL